MKRSRFTDEQIIGILKDHEAGTPVSEPWGQGHASSEWFWRDEIASSLKRLFR
ncbi:hypothetical protein JOH50_006679 [Rhizobium leguminosarum]|nr:hypothetical protein [Rhizobium leguminosarum]